MARPTNRSDTAGILYALAGFTLLTCGDAIIKSMAGEWPPVAVAALRFSLGAIGLAAILLVREGPRAFVPSHPWLHAGRGLCMAAASLLFFTAVYVMPLAEATALVFVSPIIIALLSGPLLGERVPRGTFLACAIALVGVFVVLRPNLAAIGWMALLPLGAATFFALMVIGNRASAGQGSALSMQVFIAGCAAPILVLAALAGRLMEWPAFDFGAPPPGVVLRCAAVAVTASTAHWLIYRGTMLAGAATIAPTTYIQLLVAVILGWAAFKDRPDALTLLGALVIVAAGLVLWRASRKGPGKGAMRPARPPGALRD